MPSRSFLFPILLLVAAAGVVAWLKLVPAPDVPSPDTHTATIASPPAVQEDAEDVSAEPPHDVSIALKDPTQVDLSNGEGFLPSSLRNVSPEGIITPEVTAPLKRLEAKLPAVKQPEPEDAGPTGPVIVIRRPQVISAGLLTGNYLKLHLAHVDALTPGATCPTETGEEWPCGARARTALRGVVRIYALTCHKVAEIGNREITATCTRGPLDLSKWLVQYGWAVPTATAPEDYAALAEEAKSAGKGQWRRDWEPLDVSAQEDLTNTVPPSPLETAGRASESDILSSGLSDLENLPSRGQLAVDSARRSSGQETPGSTRPLDLQSGN